MSEKEFAEFVRSRITELRLKANVSEHGMSLELGKSGSYIRSITSGAALPSLKEFYNIVTYFNITPSEFFAPLDDSDTTYQRLCRRLHTLSDEDLRKVNTFLDWIEK